MDDSCQTNLLKTIGLTISLLLISTFGFASTESTTEEHANEGHEKKESVDAIAHIQDAHEWHFATIDGEHKSIPLPVILYTSDRGLEVFMSSAFHHGEKVEDEHGHVHYLYNGYEIDGHATTIHLSEERQEAGITMLDISITKNVAAMLISVLIMVWVFFVVAKGYKKNAGKAPKGLQSFFEPIIIFIRDDIAKENIGHRYAKYMPYLLTIFFFIWFNNLLGLMPGAANVTGNIAVTLTLAVFTLLITVVSGRRTYWMHILDPLGNSMPVVAKIPLYIILIPIELIGILTKPFSLMIRLFANISAGHIIILSIIGLTFMAQSIAGYMIGGVSVLFATVMMMLELFVALLQAYIFTMLSAMYFGQAVEEGHH